MFLTPGDWIIIAGYLVGCMAAGIWMRRYIRDVDDFAVAGREMDTHLGVASLAATEVGIVTIMYTAQMGFKNGPAGATPGVVMCLAMLFVGMTGFVIGPLRDAGVMTIPELFEKRFGKSVRWLAGLVVILGGILNMGIFLRLGGEFLMYVTGLDSQTSFNLSLGGMTWHLGFLEVIMLSLLALVLIYTVLGGMVSVLVTDYLQFLVMGLGIVITSVLVLWNIPWSDFTARLDQADVSGQAFKEQVEAENKKDRETVEQARREKGDAAAEQRAAEIAQTRFDKLGHDAPELAKKFVLVSNKPEDKQPLTLVDPYNPIKAFGWGYVFWQALSALAIMTTWQTIIARVLSAQDSRTAKRVYRGTSFYLVGRFALPGLWGAAAFLYFCSQGGLPANVGSLQAMPCYLGKILGPGLLGMVLAAMLAAEMSTDAGYLLTWATVIYNDLISPCLRKPLSQKIRLLLIRLMVLAIGVFLIFYGLLYELKGRAWDYLLVTGNIYLASLFTLLVAALYWKGANRTGAVAAIVFGAVGPLSFLIVNAVVKDPAWQISPELSGLAAFGMAFGGMIFGSWAGWIWGGKKNAATSEVTR
jgi:Na+/proline symporter